MAKIKFGMMMTDARGKLGGQVFSKNRGGAYIRTKVTPSNPRTLDQQSNRALLGSLSQGWSGLTDDQRATWNAAVPNWARTNIFGDSHNPSGKNLYVQLNKNILAAGGDLLDLAPEKIEMAILGLTSVTIDISSTSCTLAYDGTITGFAVQVSATPQLTQGTSNAKNKFRAIYTVAGGSISPTALYSAYVAKFGTPTAGANIQFAVKLIADNGQVSVPEGAKALVQA